MKRKKKYVNIDETDIWKISMKFKSITFFYRQVILFFHSIAFYFLFSLKEGMHFCSVFFSLRGITCLFKWNGEKNIYVLNNFSGFYDEKKKTLLSFENVTIIILQVITLLMMWVMLLVIIMVRRMWQQSVR